MPVALRPVASAVRPASAALRPLGERGYAPRAVRRRNEHNHRLLTPLLGLRPAERPAVASQDPVSCWQPDPRLATSVAPLLSGGWGLCPGCALLCRETLRPAACVPCGLPASRLLRPLWPALRCVTGRGGLRPVARACRGLWPVATRCGLCAGRCALRCVVPRAACLRAMYVRRRCAYIYVAGVAPTRRAP